MYKKIFGLICVFLIFLISQFLTFPSSYSLFPNPQSLIPNLLLPTPIFSQDENTVEESSPPQQPLMLEFEVERPKEELPKPKKLNFWEIAKEEYALKGNINTSKNFLKEVSSGKDQSFDSTLNNYYIETKKTFGQIKDFAVKFQKSRQEQLAQLSENKVNNLSFSHKYLNFSLSDTTNTNGTSAMTGASTNTNNSKQYKFDFIIPNLPKINLSLTDTSSVAGQATQTTQNNTTMSGQLSTSINIGKSQLNLARNWSEAEDVVNQSQNESNQNQLTIATPFNLPIPPFSKGGIKGGLNGSSGSSDPAKFTFSLTQVNSSATPKDITQKSENDGVTMGLNFEIPLMKELKATLNFTKNKNHNKTSLKVQSMDTTTKDINLSYNPTKIISIQSGYNISDTSSSGKTNAAKFNININHAGMFIDGTTVINFQDNETTSSTTENETKTTGLNNTIKISPTMQLTNQYTITETAANQLTQNAATSGKTKNYSTTFTHNISPTLNYNIGYNIQSSKNDSATAKSKNNNNVLNNTISKKVNKPLKRMFKEDNSSLNITLTTAINETKSQQHNLAKNKNKNKSQAIAYTLPLKDFNFTYNFTKNFNRSKGSSAKLTKIKGRNNTFNFTLKLKENIDISSSLALNSTGGSETETRSLKAMWKIDENASYSLSYDYSLARTFIPTPSKTKKFSFLNSLNYNF